MNGMKKISAFVGIIITLTVIGNQYAVAQSIHWGITGGLNLSSHINKFRYSEDDINLNLSPNITSDFQAGLIARKSLSPSFRLQMEPSIMVLGAYYDETFMLRGFEFNTSSRTKLMYLRLPVLFQLSTMPRQKKVYGRQFASTTYHLTGGFFGGYLLDAHFTGTNTGAPVGIPFEGDFSNDITSQYSSYDGGIIFGAGFEHGYNHKIGFETRAQYSFLNSGENRDSNFHPRNIAITLSMYFLL